MEYDSTGGLWREFLPVRRVGQVADHREGPVQDKLDLRRGWPSLVFIGLDKVKQVFRGPRVGPGGPI
eukprot:7299572-Pyramimonas_sp.AAC.1